MTNMAGYLDLYYRYVAHQHTTQAIMTQTAQYRAFPFSGIAGNLAQPIIALRRIPLFFDIYALLHYNQAEYIPRMRHCQSAVPALPRDGASLLRIQVQSVSCFPVAAGMKFLICPHPHV